MCFKQKDVRMFLLSMMVPLVFLQSATGNPYCSLNDTHIDCFPCSKDCMNRNQTCFLCPKKCGKANNCDFVCEPTCLNQTCEYVEGDSVPVCTKGCIDGHAGGRCQEYCSEGCKTCDQDTGRHCTSCLEGLEGQHCNITLLASTLTVPSSNSISKCSEECNFCKDDDVVCEECTDETRCQDPCGCNGLRLTTDSKQFPPTSTSAHDSMSTHPQTGEVTEASGYTIYVVGIMSALCTGIVFVCYHVYRKKYSCVHHRPGGRGRTTNYSTDGSSFTYTGYTYIDERNLGSCHDRTNVMPINVPRCSGVNYYEEMGNRLSLSEEYHGSETSLSAWSETLFGNLFEVNNESDTDSHLTVSEGQLNEKVSMTHVYEMHYSKYITPEVTINANQGVSNV